MMTTGRIAKALRKNTISPTGNLAPAARMSALISESNSTAASLIAIA